MHAESQRTESSVTSGERRPSGRRKLPDPPDPDNLPIDYPGAGWDSSRYPSAASGSLRAQHHGHRKSLKP